LANPTEEGRQKALASIKKNMTEDEAKNVDVRYNEKTKKYEVFIKDSSAIDLKNASQGYKDLVDRVNNHNLILNFTLLGKDETISLEMNGSQVTISNSDLSQQKDGLFAGGGFVMEQSDGSFTVVVAEGGFEPGVEGFINGCKGINKTLTVPFPDYIVTAHELFGETYKYTPAGQKEGLQNDIVKDSNRVIEIENKYRDFHGLPHRTGRDHLLIVDSQ
jgi:hypothetical protein